MKKYVADIYLSIIVLISNQHSLDSVFANQRAHNFLSCDYNLQSDTSFHHLAIKTLQTMQDHHPTQQNRNPFENFPPPIKHEYINHKACPHEFDKHSVLFCIYGIM